VLALGALAWLPADADTVASSAEWKKLKKKLGADLGGNDMKRRLRAIERLGYADWPDAVEQLIKLVKKPDPRVDALEKRFNKLVKAMVKIQKSVQARFGYITREERRNRNTYLAEMATLRRTLNSVSATKRTIVDALGLTRNPEAVLRITKATDKERDPVTKAHLLLALATIPDKDATDIIRAAVAQEDRPWVRTAAIAALSQRGAADGLDLLLGALTDDAWPVRAAAVDALKKLGKAALPDAVPPLLQLLAEEQGRLKGDVADALSAMTGASVGADADLWRSWWEANKEKILKGEEGAAGGDSKKKHGTTARFYGIPTTSRRIAFVIDLSGSMDEPANLPDDPAKRRRQRGGATSTGHGGGKGDGPPPPSDPSQRPLPRNPSKLDVVKKELMQAIWSLPEDALFGLVGYNADVQLLGRGIMKATRANKVDVGKMVSEWVANGGTNIYDALVLALSLGQDKKRPDKKFTAGVDTIYLLSDGVPNLGRIVDPDEIIADITARVKTRRIKIHTIWVDTGEGGANPQVKEDAERGGEFMRELAEKTGGKFVKR
jgi:hypothetical protein